MVGVTGGRRGDSASALRASLLKEGGASAAGGARGLGGGSTVEVTSGLGVAAALGLLVVLVHGERELLLGAADTVGTVVTGGSVGGDTVTDVVATDGTEKLANLLTLNVVLGNTLQALLHAGAEVLVRRGRERAGSGLPFITDSGARLQSRVGRAVVALLDTSGRSLVDLRGQVVEVVQGADLVAINRDETF